MDLDYVMGLGYRIAIDGIAEGQSERIGGEMANGGEAYFVPRGGYLGRRVLTNGKKPPVGKA